MLLRDLMAHMRKRYIRITPARGQFLSDEPLAQKKPWFGYEEIPPSKVALAFEMFKILESLDVTVWGMAETPGNGLLHVLYSDIVYVPGVVVDTPINKNLKHAYSSDDGETWAVQEIPLGSGLEYAIHEAEIAGGNSRVHILYSTKRFPTPRSKRVIAVEIDPGSTGAFRNFTIWTQCIGSVAHPDDSGGGLGGTGLINVREDATYEFTFGGTPEPNVTHIKIRANTFGGSGSELYKNPVTDVLGEFVNPWPGTHTFTKKLDTGTAENYLTVTGTRRRLVYMKTGTDGITWDSGSIATVDQDTIPPRTGTVDTSPTSQRVDLGTFRSPIAYMRSISLSVDENDVTSFFYLFDGWVGVHKVTADQIEALYYKQDPGDARFAVDELTAGDATGIHFGYLELWRLQNVLLATWRHTGFDPIDGYDALRWRSKKTGAWTSIATLWQDTIDETHEGVRLHPGSGLIALLMSRHDNNGTRLWDRLFRRDFQVATQAFDAEVEIGADIPTTEGSEARFSGGMNDALLSVFAEGYPNFGFPVSGGKNLWVIESDESTKVFDGEEPTELDPTFNAADLLRVIDAPRVVTDNRRFVLLEHFINSGTNRIYYCGRWQP